ncbi:MAG: hypothetical protein DSO07_01660 [Thermoproteota archaeon]|jgi:hypothetical protein|nr:MAG: hypothetical protein DSO07_01660 [Candidatus Korarchaeota archaeon]
MTSYPSIERELIFPEYLSYCFHIKGYISKIHGVAIEFVESTGEWESDNWKIDIEEIDRSIEDFVLPLIPEGKNGFFEIAAEGTVLENLNLITDEFFAKYKGIIKTLSKGANLLGKDIGWFVRVRSGDVKLIDIGIACRTGDRDILKEIKFLWIIGTNNAEFFSEAVAKHHAVQDVQRYLVRLIPKIPIPLLMESIEYYNRLIRKKEVREEEILKFLEKHPFMLSLDAKQSLYKPSLSEKHIPDFIIKTSKEKFLIIEIEHPRARLFTKQMDETKELRKARTQMEEYLSFIRNNIIYLRTKYPGLSAENIEGLIVIGLGDILTEKERQRLNQLNYSLKGYQIKTFDELAEVLITFLKNLGVRYGPFGD